MKHFITFQKKKGIYLEAGTQPYSNQLPMQIQSELMKYGFMFDKDLFNFLGTQSEQVLTEIYSDLCKGLREVVGTGGYEPIYRNFPQSVQDMSYFEFAMNAIFHYWSEGYWRPEDAGYMEREFKLEPINYKELKLLTKAQFDSIFTDIVYSGSSISKWDKEIVDYFIDSNLAPELEFNKILFKETKAYIGKRYLESGKELPIKSATDVLRIYSAFCGGDEGLKENTKFKQPKRSVKNSLLRTLDGCYDLEESFKNYRENWLRVLFYLNPLTKENSIKFPVLADFVKKLRNQPELLRTFNSYLEEALTNKDRKVFDLLKKRKGVFMRRMNQLIDIFGPSAIDEFKVLDPSFDQMVNLYNYFSDRDQEKERAVVLAGQSKSDVTTFGALKAMDPKIVESIRMKLMTGIYTRVKKTDKKVFIDRALYYSPLALNNRASSFSLDSKAIGTVVKLPDDGKIVRCFVHWVGLSDIDLSGMCIDSKLKVEKVGWNGKHTLDKAITYSGDNTGHSSKNAEYLDLNLNELEKLGIEWVIIDAKVYRGNNYSKWQGEGVHAGWMMRKHPQSNSHWLPETLSQSMKLQSNSSSAYLMAVHIPSKNLVYLDVAQSGETIITNEKDALKMKVFLDKFVQLDDGSDEINWKKINQGHILNLLAVKVVDTKEEAELVFDENTNWETIARYMNEETIS